MFPHVIRLRYFSSTAGNRTKTEIFEICFTHFSWRTTAKAPALARSGDVFCTTGKTEIIFNTKTAGGCGVAPFSSLPPLFRRQQTAAAACCATETNEVMDERGQILTTLKMRLIRSGNGYNKYPPA
ncbi:hypothetical protein CXD66_13455 [Salmonella enterica subsp. enterica serovar Newport]|nr:hypothetical protein [Salmonella enterica]ECA4623115.1 hypothetical protein [Salmonella enterica subsp. enterica serovar Newport]ECU8897469.1 hypothetical protein [Salmonella enterica subsp. enterica serovar Hartford]EAB3612729.1 hypothetical protein [Salmonella enterica]EAM5409765.1 hypothetical protein [Salmonella enterica]